MFEQFTVWAENLILDFSYFGIFLISVISTSTIFLPLPFYTIIFFATSLGLNPAIVSFLSGFGSAIGELTGYGIGYGGRKVLKRKYKKYFSLGERWFKKNGFLTIVVFAVTPLPDDVVGIIGGMCRYKIEKFFLASFIGKLILCTIITYSGYFIMPTILRLFVW